MTVDRNGNYIIAESGWNNLTRYTPTGVRTVIYNFTGYAGPAGVAIDSQGNYIVVEHGRDVLSKITPSGERTVIYEFEPDTCPVCVVVVPVAVGGYIVSIERLSVLAPYLGLVGIVGSISTIYIIRKKRKV